MCSQQDKRGGDQYLRWLVEGFNEALADTGLIDMENVGHQFTWERGRGKEEWTEVHLDRAVTSKSWLNMFPLAKLYNLEGSTSDHSPIFVVPKKSEQSRGRGKFRFENAWLLEPMCYQVVMESWKEVEGDDIQQKIKKCSENLEVWGREITSNFSGTIKKCKADLKKYRGRRDLQATEKFEKLHLTLE